LDEGLLPRVVVIASEARDLGFSRDQTQIPRTRDHYSVRRKAPPHQGKDVWIFSDWGLGNAGKTGADVTVTIDSVDTGDRIAFYSWFPAVSAVERPVAVDVTLKGEHYRGAATLKQTDFGITPVTVAGGTVKVKDEVKIEFEVVLRKWTVGNDGERKCPVAPKQLKELVSSWIRIGNILGSDGIGKRQCISVCIAEAARSHERTTRCFIYAEPAGFLIGSQRDFCWCWPNQQAVTVQGSHFLQEDAPETVGKATARFMEKVLAGQIGLRM
jgi:hypothetical protein